MTATAKPKIDWTKPVQARSRTGGDWRTIDVLRTDVKSDWPVVFIWTYDDGNQFPITCTLNGCGCDFQFRNTPAPPVPFEFTRWVNVYKREDGLLSVGACLFDTQQEGAVMAARQSCVTVPVTIRGEWKAGEGAK